MIDNKDEHLFVWNAPSIQKPEFRLYYDDLGNIICYTGEKLEGNYIVVDAQTFAEGRYDVRVLDGRIVKDSPNATIVRLTPSDSGHLCASEDLSIILSEDDDVEKRYWKLIAYEFR
jgi:hypothetical protein